MSDVSHQSPPLGRGSSPMLDEAWAARLQVKRNRTRAAVAVSAGITLIWFIAVTSLGLWDRIVGLWPATLTMVFGSVVAGSTPQGGGVVAFPVFTKVLNMPAEVARTFSLCIQSVGMVAATAWIMINRRPVDWRAVGIVTGAAVIGFFVVAAITADLGRPFAPALLPGPYVKITFTIVLIAMAFVVYQGTRTGLREVHMVMPPMNGRMISTLLLCGLLGGISTGLVGSGADVFLYLALVLFFGVDPKVGVPSSVICMALLSVLGFFWFGLIGGQLFVSLDEAGQVAALNGEPVAFTPPASLAFGEGDGAPARRYDVLGLWLAAIPVVCWGAPIGTWIAARLTTRNLVRFVTLLALSEVISTAIFLKPLRTDMGLLAYAVFGTLITIFVLRGIALRRDRVFRLPGVNIDNAVHSERIDLAAGFTTRADTTS